MSRYIATALLAIAAAVITVTHLAFMSDQPDLPHAALMAGA
jgi:hypothetical protein